MPVWCQIPQFASFQFAWQWRFLPSKTPPFGELVVRRRRSMVAFSAHENRDGGEDLAWFSEGSIPAVYVQQDDQERAR